MIISLKRIILGYALVWFLLNDQIKLFAYRIFAPVKTPSLVQKSLDMTA
jgi:H+-transporting ATPase